jgi:hypothetical protein
MKRLLTFVLVLFATTAFAGPNGYHGSALYTPHHHHRHHGGWGWVGPALIGGAVVYAITRPPVVVQQPPVVVAPPTDIVYIDGIAYRKQWILVNGGYQEVLVRL